MRSALKILPIPLILLSAACTAGDSPDPGSQGGTKGVSASEALAALAERYWEWHLETSPRSATSIGDRRYDDRLADITPAGRDRRYGAIEAFLAELGAIERESLAGQDLISYLALEEELQDDLDRRVCRLAEWRVDHRSGPQVSLLNIADIQRVETPADGEKMVRRWRAMGPYVHAYIRAASDAAGEARRRMAPRRARRGAARGMVGRGARGIRDRAAGGHRGERAASL
jgi:uncharacterized protein (DUF885 family)